MARAVEISISTSALGFNEYSKHRLSLIDTALFLGVDCFLVRNEKTGIGVLAGGADGAIDGFYESMVKTYGKDKVKQTRYDGHIPPFDKYILYAQLEEACECVEALGAMRGQVP